MGTILDRTDDIEMFRPLKTNERALLERALRLLPGIVERGPGYDKEASFPTEDIEDMRKEGLLSITIPEEYGGHGFWSGTSYLPYYLVLEALSTATMSSAWAMRVHCNAVGMVAGHGNDEQKSRVFKAVVEDGVILATIGSEADPKKRGDGSGHPSGKSELVRVDGGYRLTAVKHFASNATAAGYFVVHTEAPGGGTRGEKYQLVLVPRETEGLSLEDNWDVMGARATASWAVKFDDVFVPDEDVLGQPGDWVYQDSRTMTASHAAVLVGTAQGAYDFTREELKKRPSLAQNDYVSYKFADMDARIQAARASLWYAALLWERGEHNQAQLASLRAVHTAKDAALSVVSEALEIYGARGSFRFLPLEMRYRDVRVLSLHHRESNLMRILANAELGAPYHSKQNYGPPVPTGGLADADHAEDET